MSDTSQRRMLESQAPPGLPCGTVQVSVLVPMSAARVWPVLTRRDLVGQWFGDLSDSLRSGGHHRLDFGDGDFFEIYDVVLNLPSRVSYNWRFLGTGPINSISWHIEPKDGASLVTVTDREDSRELKTAAELVKGWTDFLARLQGYCSTGQNTRYGWRQEFDGSIELPAEAATAASVLLSPAGQRCWMPWSGGAPKQDATVTVDDGLQPSQLNVSGAQNAGDLGISFALGCSQWLVPTECVVQVRERPRGSLLVVSHTGWQTISDNDHERSVQRQRFGRLWTKALHAAQEIMATENSRRNSGAH